jgi:antitoxin YefM
MIVISSREFREKQKMYLDLVDQKERGKNKAYALTPITDAERFFANPEVKARILHSLEQAEKGNLTTVAKEDIKSILGV